MLEALIKYDDRPRGKSLPTRGTLFPSRPESVVFRPLIWVLTNMALFLLPTVMSSAVVALFGSHLGLCGHQAPEELAYTFTYLSVFAGSLLIFFGDDEPSSSRSHRKRNTKRLDEFIPAEQLDEFGNPTPFRQSTKRKRDSDFSGEDSSSSDSDIEEVISNDELAASLPSKTIPRSRSGKPPKKKSKGKGKAVEPPVPSSSSSSNAPSELNPTGATSSPAVAPNPPKPPRRKRNPIYYFFEEFDQHGDGSVEEGARYYKCYLGNRKVLKIGRKMNHNTHGLQSHLQSHFIAHYRLYKVLNSRAGPPTDVELAVARGKTPVTAEMAAEYLQNLESISSNIKDMFEKQAAASEAR
ncbi:hypothetical protein B0H14DRAFT_3508775 [Mycena olivaceomarginata]|nr:hypothetical protein B0H14DRAFT_3508775 [Mycena olivaceomarginata]